MLEPLVPRFDGKTFIWPVRIYYEDTDLGGVVYHANYLRYMERARTEFFRALDLTAAYPDDPVPSFWALRKASLEYIRPAKFNDLLEVRSTVVELTGARLSADQQIWCGDVLLTRGHVQACIISLSGKPKRIPPAVHDKILPFLSETVG